jgi:alcohol dehydrogenase YqhD (iron-dependent ADH family)
MAGFTYYTPTKVVFGKETEQQTGKLVKAAGAKKVLIHYGSGSVIRSGLLDRVKETLCKEEIEYVELGGVVPNPRLSLVYEGIELAKREGVEFILAVGGGSVIDSAKAIGYGVPNEGDVWDFYDRKRTADACVPIGVILTIAATGSEMSDSSVITKEEGWVKRGYNSDLCRPVFAIMNPELTMTLPDYQTACGCADILMHTMERYFTNGDQMEITDSMAEALLRTVMENAMILVNEPDNYDARAEIMWAGSLSHNGLTGCGSTDKDFATHGLEHEIGGMFDVAHGAGLTAIWGSWARYVYRDCLHRFSRFAVNVMQIDSKDKEEEMVALEGIEAMEEFFRKINLPVTMKELGIEPTDEQIEELARKCSVACGGKKGSAKVLKESDMKIIYEMAR